MRKPTGALWAQLVQSFRVHAGDCPGRCNLSVPGSLMEHYGRVCNHTIDPWLRCLPVSVASVLGDEDNRPAIQWNLLGTLGPNATLWVHIPETIQCSEEGGRTILHGCLLFSSANLGGWCLQACVYRRRAGNQMQTWGWKRGSNRATHMLHALLYFAATSQIPEFLFRDTSGTHSDPSYYFPMLEGAQLAGDNDAGRGKVAVVDRRTDRHA